MRSTSDGVLHVYLQVFVKDFFTAENYYLSSRRKVSKGIVLFISDNVYNKDHVFIENFLSLFYFKFFNFETAVKGTKIKKMEYMDFIHDYRAKVNLEKHLKKRKNDHN